MPCPHCQSADCRYSRRRSWERLVPKTPLLRPMRCRDCRRRFWGSSQAGLTPGGALRRHSSWLFPLVLALSISMLYIHNLPYGKGQEDGSEEPPQTEERDEESLQLENEDSDRQLSALRLTPFEEGLQLEILGAVPLEHSALRHFQVPDRLVLDLPGPWDPPFPPTEGLRHPLLDRVRLFERGTDLRLELLLGQLAVEASLEETEEGVRITVLPSL